MPPRTPSGKRLADTPRLLNYLPRLLLFPLQWNTGLAIGMFALFFWVGLQSLLGIALLGVSVLWLLAYLERLIESASDGSADPPPFGGDQVMLANAASLRLLVGPALVASLWFQGRENSGLLASALVSGACFLLPAYLLVGTHFGLAAALNPVRLLGVVWVTGTAYLLACGLLALAGLLFLQVSGELGLLALLSVMIYLLVLCAHLLGFVAFQHAERLGLPVRMSLSTAEEARLDGQTARFEKALADLKAAHLRKDLDAEMRAVALPLDEYPQPLYLAEALYSHSHGRAHKQVVLTLGSRFIDRLLAAGRTPRALDVYRECLDLSRLFHRFVGAPVRLQLARYAASGHAEPMFDALTLDGLDRASNQEELIDWGLLRLRHLLEVRNDEPGAREVLGRLPVMPVLNAHAAEIAAYRRLLG